MSAPLWTSSAMAAAMRAELRGALPDARDAAFPSTPARIAPGEAFFAIKGDVHDGHDFVAAALKAGAALAVVAAAQARQVSKPMRRCWWCDDVLDGLVDLARAARARLEAKVIAVTGSVGKTGDQGGAAARARRAGRDPCVGRVLQQSLGRAAVAGALPGERRALRCSKSGMNHAGEIDAADQAGAAACRDHHHGRAGASGILRRHRGDRRRQGGNLRGRRARRRGGDQPRQSAIRTAGASAPRSRRLAHRVVRRAREGRRAAARSVRCRPTCSTVQAHILGHDVTYKLGAPGRHMVMNSLAVLAAATLAGADLALAALALSQVEPAAGRGARRDARAGRAARRC